MDEDIKAQLVLILKDLRENASPAWQELLRQYSGHHFMMAICCLISLLTSIGFFIYVNKIAKNKNIGFEDREEVQQVGIVLGHLLGVIGTIISFCLFFSNLSVSYYPLYQVLDSILK